jgi:DNA modification methylase
MNQPLTTRKNNTIDCEIPPTNPYLSILQGEFPWCLDDSEDTGASSDLIGCFDLVIAEPSVSNKSHSLQKRLQERCHPNTSWIVHTELFMKENSSLLVFSPLESIGSYVDALLKAGLNYNTTYLWQKKRAEKSVDSTDPFSAILWASKGSPSYVPFASETRLINSSLITNSEISEKYSLLQFLVQSFTKPDMLVLEPFTNSLELMSVCQKLSRYCLAISRKRSLVKQTEQLLVESLQQTA